MVFHTDHSIIEDCSPRTPAGFTLIEAVVAITLIGIGVATTIGALTKFNSIAATSRNVTGATAVLMNQADLFQTMSPFNPARGEIPKDMANTPPTYDMTVTTPGVPHTIGYKDPNGSGVSTQADPWPVYREPARWNYANTAARQGATGFNANEVGQLAYQSDTQTYWRLQSTAPTWTQDDAGGTIVRGSLTCTVTDISTAAMPNTYQAVFKIGYQYLGRGPTWSNERNRWEYQQSISVIRTSDI